MFVQTCKRNYDECAHA